jgi:hypothetical protein
VPRLSQEKLWVTDPALLHLSSSKLIARLIVVTDIVKENAREDG